MTGATTLLNALPPDDAASAAQLLPLAYDELSALVNSFAFCRVVVSDGRVLPGAYGEPGLPLAAAQEAQPDRGGEGDAAEGE